MDIWHVVTTVWGDLFSAAAVKQILQTGGGCLAQMLTNIETEIQTLLSNAVSDVVNAAAYLAQAAALQILKASLQNAANAMPGGL
jgi:F0F1-type ATP synthase membrane subunit b/b'